MSTAIKTEEVILESTEYNSTEELDEELQLQLEDSGGESYIQYQDEVPQQRQRQDSQNSNMNLSGTGGGGSGSGAASNGGKNVLENEKRMRREIANSNERRRMQSINAGFQNLRSLLPRHEGEKLSKAAILQQTSQYICELENQKTQLLAQNSQLKRQLGQHEPNTSGGGAGEAVPNESVNGVAIKKRKLTDNVINVQTISDSSDEGLGSMSPEPMTLLTAQQGVVNTKTASTIIAHNATKELLEMKKQLDKERRMRNMLEDELQTIKRQLYSVATAPPQSSSSGTTTTYIPREVIEHTDNLMRNDVMEELGTVSYVEIDEVTGQQQVVVCSSIEELESEAAAAAADIISEDNVQEEVILSSSTESEQEINVNAIAKAYAEGTSPTAAVLQPILQAAIKATPKVEVERINETIMKVKTEKIEQPSGLTRSRQNLETIVEAIRHLEGDHLFGDVAEQQKLQQQKAQEAPLALTTKQQQQAHVRAQHTTLAELRPFLQIKGNKQVTIVGGSGAALTLAHQKLAAAAKQGGQQQQLKDGSSSSATVMPTAIFKVQTSTTPADSSGSSGGNGSNTATTQQITITTAALKQCRPGVIVAKQLS